MLLYTFTYIGPDIPVSAHVPEIREELMLQDYRGAFYVHASLVNEDGVHYEVHSVENEAATLAAAFKEQDPFYKENMTYYLRLANIMLNAQKNIYYV